MSVRPVSELAAASRSTMQRHRDRAAELDRIPELPSPGAGVGGGMLCVITGSEEMTQANQWRYTCQRVVSMSVDGGHVTAEVNEDVEYTAYSNVELPNSATGQQGNGADVDDDAYAFGTAAILPVPDGVAVRLWPMLGVAGAYVFDSPANGIHPTCAYGE